jgi:hypothetical protein
MSEGIERAAFDAISEMAEKYFDQTQSDSGPENCRALTEAFAFFMLSVADDKAHLAYQVMTETMAQAYREFLMLDATIVGKSLEGVSE